jgi:hypothetical protein
MRTEKFNLAAVRQFWQCHDKWLGQLNIEKLSTTTHPFITDKFKMRDNLDDLYKLGWTVQDVEGDGNCGFYAFILGLLNVGNPDFYVPYTVNTPDYKTEWRKKVYEIRHVLRDHSQHLLRWVYPKKSRNLEDDMWTFAQALSHEEIDGVEIQGKKRVVGLSNQLAPEWFSTEGKEKYEVYFHPRFRTARAFHMNVGWAPHVLASKYQMRVLVYFMLVKGNEHTWSIMSFEYMNEYHTSQDSPHVKVHQEYDILDVESLRMKRISDVEFNRILTIELLFQTGHHDNSTQHFQYLQRSVCTGVDIPLSPPPLSRDAQPTIAEFMSRHHDSFNWTGSSDRHECNDVEMSGAYLNEDSGPEDDDDSGTGGDIFTLDACDQPNMKKPSNIMDNKRKKETDKIPQKANKKPTKSTHLTRRELSMQRTLLTSHFNVLVTRGEITPMRLRFEPKTNRYYVMNSVDGKKARHLVDPITLGTYNELLVESARKHAGIWVGPTIGSARTGCVGTGDAPVQLCTKQVSPYQQVNQPFCLCYSMANALFYTDYKEAAELMYSAAERLSKNHFEGQIGELISLMQNILPVIGSPTVYGQRLTTQNRKKRSLSWDQLFGERSPFPTLVIPQLPNGKFDHAFCVVDDLIFDSTTPRALKLCMDSVKWLFKEQEPTIYRAYRFNTKYSPPGLPKKYKTKGGYKHQSKENWQRDSS